MKITCPQCQFSRQVPEEKVPSSTFMVTCPHCQHRFKMERELSSAHPQSNHTHDEPPNNAYDHAQVNNASPYPTQHAEHDQQEQSKPENPKAHNNTAPTAEYYTKQSQEQNLENTQGFAHNDAENATPIYQDSTENLQDSNESFGIENPWDTAKDHGYISAFYQSSMRILFAAPRFFFGLHAQSPILPALLFFCIVTICQISFERFWGGVIASSLAPMSANDPVLQFAVEFLTPQMPFFMHLLLGTLFNVLKLLFCVIIFTMLFHFIAPKKGGFPLIFQVAAYSSAPMLLCAVPMIGSLVGFVWSIATTLIGCRYALRLDWPRTLLGVLPTYVFGLYMALQFVSMWWGFLSKVS